MLPKRHFRNVFIFYTCAFGVNEHGQENEINVFPAAPVAINVEIGRVWMPKADLPLIVYDQNHKTNCFQYALTIQSNEV